MCRNIKKEIKELIECETKAAGKPSKEGIDFKIIHLNKKEHPIRLEKGYCAVYSFIFEGKFLKIGQAGPRSNDRYQNQHYITFSRDEGDRKKRDNASTLARTLAKNRYLGCIDENNVKEWIINNCEKYDVLIRGNPGKITLNFIEGLLQYKFEPEFEGKNKKKSK